MSGTHDDHPNKDLWSTVVPNTARADRGDIRRSGDPTVQPQLGVNGCRSLYEAFRYGWYVIIATSVGYYM